MRIAVACSGKGSLIPYIMDAVTICGVVVDRECPAEEVARKRGLPVVGYQDIKKLEPDLVVLAGYLMKAGWVDKISTINTHPSLLPAFGGKGMYGDHVYRAILDSGTKYTGVTVHWASDKYDRGEIIDQSIVRVHPNETVQSLKISVQCMERGLLGRVLKDYVRDRSLARLV